MSTALWQPIKCFSPSLFPSSPPFLLHLFFSSFLSGTCYTHRQSGWLAGWLASGWFGGWASIRRLLQNGFSTFYGSLLFCFSLLLLCFVCRCGAPKSMQMPIAKRITGVLGPA